MIGVGLGIPWRRGGAGGAASTVSVVGGGDTVIQSSSTTVSPTFHASTAEGDECFAFIMRRSSVTPPSGWALVTEQKTATDRFSIDQWLSVYRKTYETADGSSETFTQSAAGRMIGHIVTVSSTGTVSVLESDTAPYTAAVTNPGQHPIQTVTGTGAGQVVLTGSTCVSAGSSSNAYAAPGGWTQTTPTLAVDNRMVVAWKEAESGVATSGVCSHNGTASHDGAEITLLLGAA